MAGNSNRVTSFVPSKRENMFVGPCQGESLDALVATIKQAMSENKGIVFFLWKNEPKEGSRSIAGLTVAVSEPRPGGDNFRRKPIGTAPPRATNRPDPLKGLFPDNEASAAPTAAGAPTKGW